MLRKKTEWLRKVEEMSEDRLPKAVDVCGKDERDKETKRKTAKNMKR